MIEAAVRERSDALVRTLLESVRIASVSMTGEGISDQVGFLTKRLEGWGFKVEVTPTTSHPIIYAEAGMQAEAAAAGKRFLELNPRFVADPEGELTKRNYRPEDRARIIEGLRKAGLPIRGADIGASLP